MKQGSGSAGIDTNLTPYGEIQLRDRPPSGPDGPAHYAMTNPG
ncbi:hypothetical protein ACFLIM_42185 [Nonomuraea sp. M3C6]|uniref:Uncharacterized protein n=1 Tax=Nonomuraea marmarensis TaxID=3351344 RepID=A0ABW7AQY5_9ACTN